MRIGIDFGGTKIEGLVLADDGTELVRRRVPTVRNNYRGTVEAIRDLVLSLEQECGETCTVGASIPGAISPATGLIKNANADWMNGNRFDADLSLALDREVRMRNDANCFAISEYTDGAAKGAEIVFGVIIGTGVGAGLVVNGQPIDGPNGITGEWGHNPLPWPTDDERPGPDCYCGKNGCIETFLSGPGMAAEHKRRTGVDLTAKEIVARADEDPEATKTLDIYENRLARGLAHVIDILDPHVIVLGGGLSNIPRFYMNLPRLLDYWVFSDTVATRVVPPIHGDSSGVRGAAWLWPLYQQS